MVPVNPDAIPASISDRSLGRNRLAVSDTTTANSTDAATSTASTVFDSDAATYAPIDDPGKPSDEGDADTAAFDVGVGRPRRP